MLNTIFGVRLSRVFEAKHWTLVRIVGSVGSVGRCGICVGCARGACKICAPPNLYIHDL